MRVVGVRRGLGNSRKFIVYATLRGPGKPALEGVEKEGAQV